MRKIIYIVLLILVGTVSFLPVVAQEEAPTTEIRWWESTTWYLLFVRSFYDSDGDGIGDLQGVIEKLDYLNDGDPNTDDDLGITGIWLMPIMESDSYHGYDTTDYMNVEQDYGTNEDFQQLMQEAHARGIRVVVDLVLNHTSDRHPWFRASVANDPEYADWYVWEDTNPNYVGPWGAQAWYRNATRDAYYYAIFWNRMPDLNHENPAVTEEMYRFSRFWIEEMGADGFRLDAIRYLLEDEVNGRPVLADAPINRAYVGEFNAFVHSLNPEAVTIGEILISAPETIARYTNEDSVDVAFEFTLAENIISAASLSNKRDIERRLANILRVYARGEFASLTTNHDMDRLLTQLVGDEGKNRIAANLLFTLPGVPFIYYGEEIGMMGGKPDELIRRPMQWDATPVTGGFTTGTPWQPLADDFAIRTVAGQTDDPASLLSHYRSLVHLRNAHPALQYGDTYLLESNYRAAWGYIRQTPDETLLVVLNLDHDEDTRPYVFNLDEAPLTGFTSAELVYASHDLDPIAPQITETGGFVDYVPFAEPLPPQSLFVIRLQ